MLTSVQLPLRLCCKMAARTNVFLTCVRYKHGNRVKSWKSDAVRYGNVLYYPGSKKKVDPPITPAKVLMVHRVKPFKGNPWWEKDILTELGFEELKKDPVFVKNTPEMCSTLWRVKHLVRIVPVKLPEKLPNVDDLTHTYIHENGTFHVLRKLDSERYNATKEVKESCKQLKYRTISEKLRLLWVKGTLI